jgi:putative ABC transport system permease protein
MVASPGYFATLGLRLGAGREFDGSRHDIQNAVIVNRLLADRLWPGEPAVGQTILTYDEQLRTVIGVVDGLRCQHLLSAPAPCVVRPFSMGSSSGYVQIRTEGPPLALVPHLRQLLHGMAPHVALAEERTLDTHLRNLTAAERLSAVATMAAAALAIVLLAAGCASLFASMVHDSRREIAIRMAVGATNARLRGRILAQGLALTAIGVAVGAGLSRLVAMRIADQLHGVTPLDPVALVIVPMLVGASGLVSVYRAAVLATRTNPAHRLRTD